MAKFVGFAILLVFMYANANHCQVNMTHKFTKTLIKTLSIDTSRNFACSPLALQYSLGLIYAGSDGDTKHHMRHHLYLSHVEETLDKFKFIGDAIRVPDNQFNLTVLFDDTITIEKEYEKIAKKYFKTEIGRFPHSSMDIKSKITSELEKVEPGGAFWKLRLSLTSQLHFKVNWKYSFFKNDNGFEFHLLNKSSKWLPMVQTLNYFHYDKNPRLEARVIEIPLEDNKLKMVILLPDKNDGIANVTKKLESMFLPDILKNTSRTMLSLSIPVFKWNETIRFDSYIQNMGLNSLYSSKTNLSKMSNCNISSPMINQNVHIEWNEADKHSKAEEILNPSPVVYVNRPFIYFILADEMPLFYGWVVTPL